MVKRDSKLGVRISFHDCCTQQHGEASVFCSHLFFCQIAVSEQNATNFSECRIRNWHNRSGWCVGTIYKCLAALVEIANGIAFYFLLNLNIWYSRYHLNFILITVFFSESKDNVIAKPISIFGFNCCSCHRLFCVIVSKLASYSFYTRILHL